MDAAWDTLAGYVDKSPHHVLTRELQCRIIHPGARPRLVTWVFVGCRYGLTCDTGADDPTSLPIQHEVGSCEFTSELLRMHSLQHGQCKWQCLWLPSDQRSHSWCVACLSIRAPTNFKTNAAVVAAVCLRLQLL